METWGQWLKQATVASYLKVEKDKNRYMEREIRTVSNLLSAVVSLSPSISLRG